MINFKLLLFIFNKINQLTLISIFYNIYKKYNLLNYYITNIHILLKNYLFFNLFKNKNIFIFNKT